MLARLTVRVVNGELPKGSKITVMSTGRSYIADRVGSFNTEDGRLEIVVDRRSGFCYSWH